MLSSFSSEIRSAIENDRDLTFAELLDLDNRLELKQLMRISHLADIGHGDTLTYSPKVFIPLTRLCRDVCHYCTLRRFQGMLNLPICRSKKYSSSVVKVQRRDVEKPFYFGRIIQKLVIQQQGMLLKNGILLNSRLCRFVAGRALRKQVFYLI